VAELRSRAGRSADGAFPFAWFLGRAGSSPSHGFGADVLSTNFLGGFFHEVFSLDLSACPDLGRAGGDGTAVEGRLWFLPVLRLL
jgi:hypothetical protein